MVFSTDDRVLIKVLMQEKGFGAKQFIVEFLNKSWTLSGLKNCCRRFDAYGTIDRKHGS